MNIPLAISLVIAQELTLMLQLDSQRVSFLLQV
jgi:hypothetical protein